MKAMRWFVLFFALGCACQAAAQSSSGGGSCWASGSSSGGGGGGGGWTAAISVTNNGSTQGPNYSDYGIFASAYLEYINNGGYGGCYAAYGPSQTCSLGGQTQTACTSSVPNATCVTVQASYSSPAGAGGNIPAGTVYTCVSGSTWNGSLTSPACVAQPACNCSSYAGQDDGFATVITQGSPGAGSPEVSTPIEAGTVYCQGGGGLLPSGAQCEAVATVGPDPLGGTATYAIFDGSACTGSDAVDPGSSSSSGASSSGGSSGASSGGSSGASSGASGGSSGGGGSGSSSGTAAGGICATPDPAAPDFCDCASGVAVPTGDACPAAGSSSSGGGASSGSSSGGGSSGSSGTGGASSSGSGSGGSSGSSSGTSGGSSGSSSGSCTASSSGASGSSSGTCGSGGEPFSGPGDQGAPDMQDSLSTFYTAIGNTPIAQSLTSLSNGIPTGGTVPSQTFTISSWSAAPGGGQFTITPPQQVVQAIQAPLAAIMLAFFALVAVLIIFGGR